MDIQKTMNQMTIEEKALLINGATFFGTHRLEKYGIPRLFLLDGGTGLNFEQLFGELLSREKEAGGEMGRFYGSDALRKVTKSYYEMKGISEKQIIENEPSEDKLLRKWIEEKLRELSGSEKSGHDSSRFGEKSGHDSSRLGEKTGPGCYPTGMLLGSTWNEKVIWEVGAALGKEAAAYGIDILLGTPNINMMRDPRNGRLFESYSEDPFLNSVLAPAMVRGVQSQGVAANVKHFAANNQETFRTGVNETISKRALLEIYLPAFKACVDAGVATIMSAYNGINGTICTENEWLLTDLLRDEWNFDGLVLSDWGAVKNPVAAIKAGNNLAMPGPIDVTPIVDAVRNGELSEVELDKAVFRMLQFIERYRKNSGKKVDTETGCNSVAETFDDEKEERGCGSEAEISADSEEEGCCGSEEELEYDIGCKAAYSAAVEGIVLLKNENDIFPIKKDRKVVFIGEGCKKFFDCGTGSAGITTDRTTSFYEEFVKIHGDSLFIGEDSIDDIFEIISGHGDEDRKAIRNGYGDEDRIIIKNEQETDTIIVTIRITGMEGNDRKDIKLPKTEKEILEKAISIKKSMTGVKLGVILNTCGPVELEEYINEIDGLFFVSLPGMMGGKAMAALITGNENPSGRLTVSFPRRLSDTPAYLNFPGDGKNVIYGEDIFVGYRYYDTKGIKTLFPFGAGLSYTSFKYSNLRVDREEFQDKICVLVDVANVGEYDGKEVVSLYVHDKKSVLRKPEKELKAFKKLHLLRGEKACVKFELGRDSFAAYDMDLGKWVSEEGYYDLILAHDTENEIDRVTVCGKWKSEYSYSENSTIKELFEHEAINPKLYRLFNFLLIDIGVLLANYEYTSHRTLKEILADEGVGTEQIPAWFFEEIVGIERE